MKYLKSYKIFESTSIKLEDFPNQDEIREYFYDIIDNEWYSHFSIEQPAYVFFPASQLTTQVRSQMLYDMSYEKDWISKEVDELGRDTWNEYFLKAEEADENTTYRPRLPEYVWESDIVKIEGSFWNILYKEIIKGVVPAYPLIGISISLDKTETMFECLERLYESTGFRPIGDIHEKDFVDEETGDIVTLYLFELKLLKVTDIEYKNLANSTLVSQPDRKDSKLHRRNRNADLISKFL